MRLINKQPILATILVLLVLASLATSLPGTVSPAVAASQSLATPQAVYTSSNYTLREEFNYPNTAALVAAGWSLCGTSGLSSDYYVVGGGNVTLKDTGFGYRAAICWSSFPADIFQWTVSTRANVQDSGGVFSAGHTVQLTVTATNHLYLLTVDLVAARYTLRVNGAIVLDSLPFTPRQGSWHDVSLNMEMQTIEAGTISVVLDDTPTSGYSDTFSTLTGVSISPGDYGLASFDNVRIVSLVQPYFDLVIAPSSRQIPQGTNATFTISVLNFQGFIDRTVSLAAYASSALPDPRDLVVSPSNLVIGHTQSNYTAVLVVIASHARDSIFDVTVNATSGQFYRTSRVTVSLLPSPQGDFSVSVNPSFLVAHPSNGIWPEETATVTVTSLGYIDIGLVLWVTPSNVPVTLQQTGLTLHAMSKVTTTLTLSPNQGGLPADFDVQVWASNTVGLQHSATLRIYVAPHDYLPGVQPGTSGTYQLSIDSVNETAGITNTVTRVEGYNVNYRSDLYYHGSIVNSTTGSLNIATGEYGGGLLVPFFVVTPNLQINDPIYLSEHYTSFTVRSEATVQSLGSLRRVAIASRFGSPTTLWAQGAWDTSNGMLVSLNATVYLNDGRYHNVTYTLRPAFPNTTGALRVGFDASRTANTLKVAFTPSVTGGQPPYTYNWDFGDGQTSTDTTPSHTYSRPGNYTVTLTVIDSKGTPQSHSATVQASQPVSSQSTNPSSIVPRLSPTLLSQIAIVGGVVWLVLVALAAVLVIRSRPKKTPTLDYPASPGIVR